ncbi:MAG: diguanylate cyclase [Elainellaceae cyanobacterium]
MQFSRGSERLKSFGAVNLPLPLVVAVPFIAQTIVIVGLIGFLSYRAGERTVLALVDQLMLESGDRVSLYVDSSIDETRRLNGQVIEAIQQGRIDLNLNQPDLQASLQRDRYLWQQLQGNESTRWIALATPDGSYHGMTRQSQDLSPSPAHIVVANAETNGQGNYYAVNEQGERAALVETTPDPYDARSRPWYESAVTAGTSILSEPYASADERMVQVTTSAPVYGAAAPADTDPGAQPLQGVVAVDLSLQGISTYLQQNPIGDSGHLFIVNGQGKIIASSTEDEPVVVDDQTEPMHATLFNTELPLVRAAGRALYPQVASAQTDEASASDNLQASPQPSLKPIRFTVEGDRYFVKSLALEQNSELDWLIVTIVPASEFADPIQANLLRTLLVCGGALLSSIAIGYLIVRQTMSPSLLKLDQSTRAIAQGNFDALAPVAAIAKRPDDLGLLARSFHQMAEQIKHTITSLETDQQRLLTFLDALPIGVLIHQADRSVFYINRTGRDLTGAKASTASTENALATPHQLCHGDSQQDYLEEALPPLLALKGESATIDDLVIHHGDKKVALEVRAVPVLSPSGAVEYTITVLQDITERKRSEKMLKHRSLDLEHQVAETVRQCEQERQKFQTAAAEIQTLRHELEYLAKVDDLTQLANRRRFSERLMEEWQRQTRAQVPLSLVLIEIDEFQAYRDTYGHQQSDRCLISLARSLNQAVKRPADLVARYGAEEFAVILPETDLQGAIVVANRMRWIIQRLNSPHRTSSVGSAVTLSMGIATTIPALGMIQNTLITEAGRMLYRAKTLGRDRYEAVDFGHPAASSDKT